MLPLTISISIGYRLSVLGFLACDELKEEDGTGVVGNYGLWDQRAAIEWTHKNIANLGGNPKRVVLGGRSAGSFATQWVQLFTVHATSDM